MAGRLSIPYLTPRGCVTIRFRTLTDGPKYMSRAGDSIRPYNVLALHRPSPVLLVTEGELDAVAAETYTGYPAIGIPGAQAFKPHFSLMLEDYQRVIVLADGDDAGKELGRKVCASLDNAISVPMPEGMDVTDVVLKEGPESLKQRAGL